jgi:hypothetical protein
MQQSNNESNTELELLAVQFETFDQRINELDQQIKTAFVQLCAKANACISKHELVAAQLINLERDKLLMRLNSQFCRVLECLNERMSSFVSNNYSLKLAHLIKLSYLNDFDLLKKLIYRDLNLFNASKLIKLDDAYKDNRVDIFVLPMSTTRLFIFLRSINKIIVIDDRMNLLYARLLTCSASSSEFKLLNSNYIISCSGFEATIVTIYDEYLKVKRKRVMKETVSVKHVNEKEIWYYSTNSNAFICLDFNLNLVRYLNREDRGLDLKGLILHITIDRFITLELESRNSYISLICRDDSSHSRPQTKKHFELVDSIKIDADTYSYTMTTIDWKLERLYLIAREGRVYCFQCLDGKRILEIKLPYELENYNFFYMINEPANRVGPATAYFIDNYQTSIYFI